MNRTINEEWKEKKGKSYERIIYIIFFLKKDKQINQKDNIKMYTLFV